MIAVVRATVLGVSSASIAQHSPAQLASGPVRPVHLGIGQVITRAKAAAEPRAQAPLASPVRAGVAVAGDCLQREPHCGHRADVREPGERGRRRRVPDSASLQAGLVSHTHGGPGPSAADSARPPSIQRVTRARAWRTVSRPVTRPSWSSCRPYMSAVNARALAVPAGQSARCLAALVTSP